MAASQATFISKKVAILTFVAAIVIVGVAVGVSSRSQKTTDGGNKVAFSSLKRVRREIREKEPWKTLRIPRDVYLPEKYDLTLEPDLEPEKDNLFTGTVIATITVLKPTSVFMIHIKDMNVTSTTLSGGIEVDQTFHYEPNQFWVVKTKTEVPVGKIDLTLGFSGYLTHGIVGFYKSTYKDSKDKVHPLATSKFEPSYARKAFPCFDEPNLKANYTVNIIYKETVNEISGYYALSNMPADGKPVDEGNGKLKQKFKESVKMSTYLVCFIVCDFEKEGQKTTNGKQFTVYSPKGTLEQAKYSLRVGVQVIEFYEKYFNIPYPLPKQDMIAIPDFPSGAMEHWGLITFRMTAMLYDDKMASLSEKQRVTTVVAHELAHMWFGNLVTMDWWDDLWLNEGFATFIEYLGTNEAEPGYKVLDQFLAMDMKGVMMLDSTKASHPIINEVTSPDQITELFDTITYSKGCSVIRMLNSYLGEKDFKAGVTKYLNMHKWGNAKNADLWKALSESSTASPKVDVGALMDSWTKQSHYPLVTVEEVMEEGGSTIIKVRQETFLLNDDERAKAQEVHWQIPIQAEGWDGTKMTKATYLLKEKSGFFQISGSSSQFLKLNVGQYGFYRVYYKDAEWTKLTDQLKEDPHMLYAVDRAGILDDAFNLARAGKMEYEVAFKALEYLDKEDDYIPWSIAASAMNYITDTYSGSKIGTWQKFVSDKAGKILDDINFEERYNNDTFPMKRLRPTLISLACRHGNVKCLVNSKDLFRKWLEDQDANPIDVNIRQEVYQYGMRDADETSWNKVHDIYKKTVIPQEKKKLRYAMAMPRSPWILKRYIEYAKDEEHGFKSQDYFSIMESIANNPVGLPVAWEYIKSKWEQLVDRFTINDRYFGRMINRIISNFNTKFQLKDVEAFFTQYPEAGAGERARREGLTNIKNNIAWKNKNGASLTKWLETQ